MRQFARAAVVTLAVGLSSGATGCLSEPFTGSTVVVDFISGLDPSSLVVMPDGSSSHYELWVQFSEEGVLSLGKFSVTADFQVVSVPDTQRRLGAVYNPGIAIQDTGVRIVTEVLLVDATSAFVSLERNGETDIAPSGVIIMEGPLRDAEPGILRGNMTGEYTNLQGQTRVPTARVAVALAQDNADI